MVKKIAAFWLYCQDCWQEYRYHPYRSSIFIGIIALMSIALFSGIYCINLDEQRSEFLEYAFIGGMAGFAGTGFGALGALFLKSVSIKVEDSMLGFAAGMMLAASSFSLILPAIEFSTTMTGNAVSASLIVVFGIGLGVWFMLGLDKFFPHKHFHAGTFGVGYNRVSRVWLFVIAIIIHNFPEGMAIGVGFSHGDLKIGLPVTIAIAIQDIPEGLAIALSLKAAGYRPRFAVLIAILSGIMEPLGALLGFAISGGFDVAYPICLAFAAGAMIFVVSHEVIPETHRNGHQTPATVGLMIGFALMIFLDNCFG